MIVAITGASGLVGRHLRAHLEDHGHTVRAMVRTPTNHPDRIFWDPAKHEIDLDGFSKVDAVIHLAGASVAQRWTPRAKALIRDSRVLGTRLLAQSIAAGDGPPILISGSAIGYHGDGGDEVLTPDSPAGTNFLARVGRAWEDETEVARSSGARVVRVRTGIVLSAEGGALKEMMLPFKLGVGGPLGGGQQWLSWVSMDDIVRIFTFALERKGLFGPIMGTSPHPVRQRDFARALGRAVNRPAFAPAPAFAIRTLFGQMGQEMLLEGQRCHPARLIEAGFDWTHPDLDDALRAAIHEGPAAAS